MKKRPKGHWSVIAAARAARDARIATVTWLRRSELARQWQAPKLALQFRSCLIGHENGDHVHRETFQDWATGELGYPTVGEAGSWEDAAEQVLADQAEELARAQLYVMSPAMCDVTVAAAKSLDASDLDLMTEEDFPAPLGILVLPHALVIRSVTGELADDRAYMWRALAPISTGKRHATRPALRMSIFHDRYGPIQPDTFREFAARAEFTGAPLPPLMFSLTERFPLGLGPQSAADLQGQALLIENARTLIQDIKQDYREEGYNEDPGAEYAPGSEIVDHDGTFARRFLYAFFRLCDQHIAVDHPAEVTHSARATAQRAGTSPDVRVVQLRPSNTRLTAAGQAPRSWNHRWIVRMHKVRQWYPTEQCHKVIYRGPYFKGPQDKPLLDEAAKVHGLTR